MSKAFSRSAAAEVYAAARALGQEIQKITEKDGKARSRIAAAAEKTMDKDVDDVLRGTPVSFLEDEVADFDSRVLSVRFANCYELKKAGAAALKYYLKPAQASAVTAAIDNKIKEIRGVCVPRINAEARDMDSENLVKAAVDYYRQRDSFEKAEAFLRDCPGYYGLTSDLSLVSGFFKWTFASGARKKAAEAAFDTLSELVKKKGKPSRPHSGAGVSGAEAWKEYEKNSIEIHGMLESLFPELFLREEPGGFVYGLPEEFAGELSGEEILTEGLNCYLRSYQEWGVRYILRQKRVLLGDEMGLGKTIQAIAAMVSVRNSGGEHFLVICPAAVITNWCREIEKHSDLTAYRLHGDRKDELIRQWRMNGGCAVMSYEGTEIFTPADRTPIDLLVADEAHYVKNPSAQRTKRTAWLAARAKRVLFMTGTALENRQEEMKNLVSILQPALGAGLSEKMSPRQFREALMPVYYRRKREQVLSELPELVDTPCWCDMTPEDTAAYASALASGNFHEARRVSWITGDAARASKPLLLKKIIEEAEEEDRKVIVFSCYLRTLEQAVNVIGEKCMPVITGSVPPAKRQQIIDDFESAPPGTALPAQIIAGGTGLNIQTASVVVLCEPQLKPSIENQAVSRAYRMGQTRNVLVYRLLCEDTIDEQITDMLKEKQGIFDAVADISEAATKDPQLTSLLESEQKRYA
ncbi:MAG: DEAD/DEAH box helicase [Abditibacteriota bacterium]|nr:DEAD/DEAH box helicase [Abditibacteriota bacterium]